MGDMNSIFDAVTTQGLATVISLVFIVMLVMERKGDREDRKARQTTIEERDKQIIELAAQSQLIISQNTATVSKIGDALERVTQANERVSHSNEVLIGQMNALYEGVKKP